MSSGRVSTTSREARRAFHVDADVLGDIRDPRLIRAKGLGLLAIGATSFAILVVEHPDVRFALLLSCCVWAFCRAYFCAFYVIEKYVDSGAKYAGLLAFARAGFSRRRAVRESASASEGLERKRWRRSMEHRLD